MKVLVVEDDLISLGMLRSALAEMGYEVLTAVNGCEALDVLGEDRCRMVICDWEMPEMNGLEFCRRIRAEEIRGYVYVILLTAKEGASHVVEGLSAGADDFMSKPFEPEELHLRIRAGERMLSLETRDLTIFALAKLAESRDPETGGHLERVRRYSRMLTQALARRAKFADRINGRFIRLTYETSPLHDIGKVAIPDYVLLKPGRLSSDEFEIMKAHAVQGARTLECALAEYPEAEFLRMARDIAAHHHERWDGAGYPDKLAGEEIPLAARIFSVADVYDALVVRRVYKEAFRHDVARRIIIDGRDSQFDPDVVDAFLANEDAFVEIRDRFEDEHDRPMRAAG